MFIQMVDNSVGVDVIAVVVLLLSNMLLEELCPLR